MVISEQEVMRRAQLTGLLELICQALELTKTQFETAEGHYKAVGQWLAEAENPLIETAAIYPQGSMSLGTTVKPLDRDEFDIDLVCHTPRGKQYMEPGALKKLIGDRLHTNERYRPILEEKPRCWRLNYAGDFHLDITPTIPNPACCRGGELAPDKKLKEWKETNPQGYKDWFEQLAAIPVRFVVADAAFAANRAQIEPLPIPTRFKGILRRCVQLCKRHRDCTFQEEDKHLAPISVIITTLAAKSYAYCAKNRVYSSEIDVLADVIELMPDFIQVHEEGGRQFYFIWNETTHGENFADKWNADVRLAHAFYTWQQKALHAVRDLSGLMGLDRIGRHLSYEFGAPETKRAINILTESISSARVAGSLGILPASGLVVGAGRGIGVRPNTFFGR